MKMEEFKFPGEDKFLSEVIGTSRGRVTRWEWPNPFRRFFRWLSHRRSRVAGLLVGMLLLVGIFAIYPAYAFYSQIKVAMPIAFELKAAVGASDLGAIENSLEEMDAALAGVGKAYRRFGYLRVVPFLNRYYYDGQHLLAAAGLALEGGEILADALAPFAASLGLGNGGSSQTAGEQVAKLAEVLPQISSQIDSASARFLLVRQELDQIDAKRYPEEVRGIKIKFWLEESQRLLSDLDPLLTEAKSFAEVLPRLLGTPERTCLVLFQNDAELRATGGFITALGFITVKDGQVTNVEVHNVSFGTNRISAEPSGHPVARYLNTPGLLFHDANYIPDFRASAEKVLAFWQRGVGLPSVDFIIGINTGTGARLLEFTGPVVIPGYDRDLASYSNLPESCRGGGAAFTSENLACRLEYWVEGTGEDKGPVLEKLAEVLIERLTSSSAEVWAQIVDLSFTLLDEKDLLLYSPDSAEQELLEELDFAGRMKDFEGDYLHINDNNLGGKKTNLFMQETVEQSLSRLESGVWRKTVKINYYNPQVYDNWLSANYKDWLRLYVPKGSTLVSIDGAQIDPGSGEDLGKTVFSVFFYLWPQQERTITFTYDLPDGVVGDEYRLLVQKQPGTDIGLVKVEIGGKIEAFSLETDKEIEMVLK